MMSIEVLINNLHRQLEGEQVIDMAQVEEWRKMYPYFALPLLLYTQHARMGNRQAILLSNIYVGDRNLWAQQLGLVDDFSHIAAPVSESEHTETTDEAITLFLSTYGKNQDYEPDVLITDGDAQQQEAKEQEEEVPLITIPAYDYMSELEAMPDVEDGTLMQGNDLLEKFLKAEAAGEQMFSKPQYNTPAEETIAENTHNDENEALFSESLAKVYIQQRRYSKALEIIRKLSLNNPEKNIYFADQIRFLEKLIINVKN